MTLPGITFTRRRIPWSCYELRLITFQRLPNIVDGLIVHYGIDREYPGRPKETKTTTLLEQKLLAALNLAVEIEDLFAMVFSRSRTMIKMNPYLFTTWTHLKLRCWRCETVPLSFTFTWRSEAPVTVGHVNNFSKYLSQEYLTWRWNARFQAFLVYLRSRNDYGCRMRFLYFTGDFLNDLPKYQAS